MLTKNSKDNAHQQLLLPMQKCVALCVLYLFFVSLKISANSHDLQESPLSISIHPSFLARAQHTSALVQQNGTFNKATIYQSSDDLNSVNVLQLGRYNLANITQVGSNNTINLLQQGSNNSAVIIQEGDANIVNLTQLGEHAFVIHQQGNDMIVNVSVTK
ncbi:curlin subunit CsgB [Pseudoalteromonas aurantia]|uniref:Minor curlin subunit n=1 Tax=Pseudoalteromonas aurantia 208 TaxID=1314867 RepID=A0ABR9EDC5_9GAMM|nr:curlin subunit CsgB [Pseudoalteromonas aurantia]MBE0368986.1 minor curlin subunit [Pseudoalteromonas aurantia 208]